MRDPLMRLVERLVRRTDWHRKMMAEIEAVRIDNEISRAILEAKLAQTQLKAKAEIVDELKIALEVRNAHMGFWKRFSLALEKRRAELGRHDLTEDEISALVREVEPDFDAQIEALLEARNGQN